VPHHAGIPGGRAGYGSRVTEAKDDAKAGPEAAESGSAAPEAAETDVRKRFREALDRKNATPGTHPGSQVEGANSLKSSNGKTKRQFRRKSGG
jgi:hypothetical protein